MKILFEFPHQNVFFLGFLFISPYIDFLNYFCSLLHAFLNKNTQAEICTKIKNKLRTITRLRLKF